MTRTASFGLFARMYSKSALRGERAGRVVGIADVVRARVRVGLDHGLHIVRIVLAQRDLDDFVADKLASAGAVARAAHHPGSGGRSECGCAVRQGNAGARIAVHIARFDVFGALEQGLEVDVFALRVVAPAQRPHLRHGLDAFLAGAHRVFIGGDADDIRIVRGALASAAAPAVAAGLCCSACWAMANSLKKGTAAAAPPGIRPICRRE